MGITAEIFLASILLKEMRYLVYIRYLCTDLFVELLAVSNLIKKQKCITLIVPD